MSKLLAGKKCLVTGASSGIGKGTCQVLTEHGASVVGTGRNEEALKEMQESQQILQYIVSDIAEPGQCQVVVEKAVQLLGGELTTLVNCAGILKAAAMDKADFANYQANMLINAQAPFELMVHAIPHLKKQSTSSNPSIVNVSSVNGKQAFAGTATYCMSKAALDQLTRCASVDLAEYGIRVNAVNPGVIETNLQKAGGLSDNDYQAFLKRSMEVTHPLAKTLGRVGQPEEVGQLIAFLASDNAKFITGETIAIDGGRQNLGAR